MDAWWWIVVVAIVTPVVVLLLARSALRSRVDPTQVSIDPDVARRVGELGAAGRHAEAVAALREATGLAAVDAVVIADRLARRHRAAHPDGPAGGPD